MLYRQKTVVIFLLLFCCLLQTNANWYPITKNYYRSTYKSGSQNWGALQTPNGWMYFANNYGLLEYDGQIWTTYPVSNQTCVRSLHFFQNTIYAGAENEFGYYEPTRIGHLAYHSLVELLPPSDRMFGNVWKIHEINNTLYFQAENVIFKYRDGKCKKMDVGTKIEYSTVINNALYIVSQDKIMYFVGDFLAEYNIPELKGKRVVALLPGKNNAIIYVTAFHGIYINDGKSTRQLTTEVEEWLRTKQVFCAASNSDYIAIGSVQDGLTVIDYTGKIITSLNLKTGLSNNTILGVDFDRDNNLWLGLDQGIDYVALSSPISNLYGINNFYGKGTASALMDNTLFLGTNQGLYYMNWLENINHTPITLNKIPGCEGQVWELFLINNQLLCAHNNGLFIVKRNTVRKIEGVDNAWSCKPFMGNTDQLIIGTYDGFTVVKKDKKDNYVFSHKIKGYDYSVANFEDDGRYIWVRNIEQGIHRLTLNADKDSITDTRMYNRQNGLPSNLYNGVYKINGKVIIGTQRGVYSYDAGKDRFIPNVDINKMLGNKQVSVSRFCKKEKTVWFISDLSLDFATYNEKTNDYDVDFRSGEYFKDIFFPGFEHINPITDSLALIGSEIGFSLFQIPSNKSKHEFSVSLKKIYLTNKADSLIFGKSYKSEDFVPVLPYSSNSIRFEFSASEFLPNADVRYSYMLENYDKDFSSYSPIEQKEYTGLPEGKYTFIIKAISNYGDEPVISGFSFEVRPPWYRSNIAYGSYLILLFLLIYQLYRILNFEIERQKRRVEKQKQEELKAQEELFLQQQIEQEKEMMRLKTKQLEDELKMKSSELANSVMNIIEKNEIFNSINNGLTKIIGDLKVDGRESVNKKIRQLQTKIEQNVAQDENWKKVESNFDLVHEDFFKKLMETYPDLSKTERKFCALLRMNLSSKEIAQLTNIAPRSVEIARYRIRKKMGLDRSENLIELLHKM